MSTETEQAKALPAGLYKACMLCDKDFDIAVRSVKHTHSGSCPYDGEYTEHRDEGFVTTPDILTIRTEQHYGEALHEEFNTRLTRYKRCRPWLQDRANKRFETEREELRARINGSMNPKDADLAALTIAECHYKQYAPKSEEKMYEFYREMRDTLEFKTLEKEAEARSSVSYSTLQGMHPDCLKTHFSCAEERGLLNVPRYRSLALFGTCAFGMPALEFAALLEQSPRTKDYAARIAPYKDILADKELQIHFHKYAPE